MSEKLDEGDKIGGPPSVRGEVDVRSVRDEVALPPPTQQSPVRQPDHDLQRLQRRAWSDIWGRTGRINRRMKV